jgi:hypothetical protein
MARRKQKKYEISEVDLGKAIKEAELFKNMVYAEEVGMGNGGSCDLVYFNDGEVFTIEIKKQLNIKVISQAARWLDTATRVYVACPCTLTEDVRRILVALGIGYIMVYKYQDSESMGAKITLRAEPLAGDLNYWLPELKHMDKLLEAGTSAGSRSTTFSRFITRAKEYVASHPDATLKEIATNVYNHYSSVNSCIGALRKYAERGVIDKFWKD